MDFKKIYKSNKEFKERNKVIFLSAFESKFPGRSMPSPGFRYFMRGAAFGAALVLVLTAGATYADQKNVGATSVLYPLKRTSETIKVALTSESQKEELHLELANRRLEEIKEIREKTPENPKINNLSKELEKEIQNSILKIDFPKENPSAKEFFATETKTTNPDQNVSALQAPAITTQVVEDKPIPPERSGTKEEDGAERKNSSYGLNKRQLDACELWKKIIEEKDFAVVDLVNKTPEIIEKFRENCELIFNSIIIKTEGNEVEIEIED